MELREKVAQVVQESLWADPDGAPETFCDDVADRILAIPEIAEALGLTKFDQTGLPTAEDVRGILGHSISTNPPR